MAAMSVTILIVDDSPVIRDSLRGYLEQNPEWKVCGEAENGQVAVEKVRELHPDVVILDFSMPVMDGLEAARQIARIAPRSAMLMLTMYGSGPLLKEAQAAGFKDVVSKSDGIEPLVDSLKRVLEPGA
jgi:DNA-binding NarL/FixJ family response regulator